jgi:hypothetical protein
MMWVSFNLAAQTVERELGLSWGAAQKALLDACQNEEVRNRSNAHGGPDVLDDDLSAWLKAKQTPPKGGKRARIIHQLELLYPKGVPNPQLVPRKVLKADLIKRDADLAPLDEGTLKLAIDAYNADPKRS